jgi:hypothetical protein
MGTDFVSDWETERLSYDLVVTGIRMQGCAKLAVADSASHW